LKIPLAISRTVSFDLAEFSMNVRIVTSAMVGAASTVNASSSLPFKNSHRGDSGNSRMRVEMINPKMIWKPIGNLQDAIDGSKKLKPNSNQ